MLLLGGGGDPLGGEDSTDAYFLEVILGAPPKDAAKLVNRQKVQPLDLLFHFRQVIQELPRREEPQQHGRVDVLPAPLAVDQPYR